MKKSLLTFLFFLALQHLVSGQDTTVKFIFCTIDFKNPQVGQYINMAIYYDLDKQGMRPESAEQLDSAIKIVNLLSKYTFRIESHTDCRADSVYNRRLSEKRAELICQYMRRYSDSTRISFAGLGESQLAVNCPCEGKEKSPCTEEEHQKNRRHLLIIAGKLD